MNWLTGRWSLKPSYLSIVSLSTVWDLNIKICIMGIGKFHNCFLSSFIWNGFLRSKTSTY